MTGRDVFEILAVKNKKLFDALCRDYENEELRAEYEATKQALLVVHKIVYGEDTKNSD